MRILPLKLVVLALILGGCDGKLLPNFDGGVLNPEFRHLRAGDVMTGVKCAVVAYMLEREQELFRQREEYKEAFERIESNPRKGIRFQPYTLGATTQPLCGKGEHWERPTADNLCRGGGCCVPNVCKKGSLGVALWDYTEVGNPREPRGCVPVRDYSRFALDPNQSSSIVFTLNGTNSGFINYARIDATRLDGLYPHVIASGGGPTSNPFPQLLPTLKGTTDFEITVVMPQSLHVSPAVVPVLPVPSRITSGIQGQFRERVAEFKNLVSVKGAGASQIDRAVKATEDLKRQTFAVDRGPAGVADQIDRELAGQIQSDPKEARKPLVEGLKKWKDAVDKVERERIPPSFSDERAKKVEEIVRPSTNDLLTLKELDKDSAQLDLLAQGRNPNPVGVKKAIERIENKIISINDQDLRQKLSKSLKEVEQPPVMVTAAKEVAPQTPLIVEGLSPQALSVQAGEKMSKSKIVPRDRSVETSPGGAMERSVLEDDDGIVGKCVADRHGYRIGDKSYIDYLALKKMLHNVVNEQNERLHHSGPPLTLSSLVLTTSFQMTLEVQAGTVNIFRIVPLLSAPNTQFKTDHLHKLKITLQGVKKKGDPGYSQKLLASCIQRLQDNGIATGESQRCNTLEGLMLEAITETLENNAGGGG